MTKRSVPFIVVAALVFLMPCDGVVAGENSQATISINGRQVPAPMFQDQVGTGILRPTRIEIVEGTASSNRPCPGMPTASQIAERIYSQFLTQQVQFPTTKEIVLRRPLDNSQPDALKVARDIHLEVDGTGGAANSRVSFTLSDSAWTNEPPIEKHSTRLTLRSGCGAGLSDEIYSLIDIGIAKLIDRIRISQKQ